MLLNAMPGFQDSKWCHLCAAGSHLQIDNVLLHLLLYPKCGECTVIWWQRMGLEIRGLFKGKESDIGTIWSECMVHFMLIVFVVDCLTFHRGQARISRCMLSCSNRQDYRSFYMFFECASLRFTVKRSFYV